MKRLLSTLLVIIAAASLSGYELLSIGDIPTAGILQYGEAELNTKIYHQNGIIVGGSVGLFSRFMFGISYGGENIVGNDKPSWNEKVEVNAKYRIVDESPTFPAVAIGFDTQGHGAYNPEVKRYDIKSKGFYAVASRNYLLMGNIGLHLGVNYSLENKDDQKSVNLFSGIDKSLGDSFIFTIDYDAALNDKDPGVNIGSEENDDNFIKSLKKRKGNGYLNLSLMHRFSDSLSIKLIAYDILENNRVTKGADRAIIINYFMKF